MIGWTKAPEGAEFYSYGSFWKYDTGKLFFHSGSSWDLLWCNVPVDNHLQRLKQSSDYQQRPEESKVKHYTGQMTAEQLKNTKIRILSPEHSKDFQEMCFEAGVCLYNDAIPKKARHTDKRYIYVMDNTIYHSDDSHEYFLSAPETEITWQPEEPIEANTVNSIKITSSNGRVSENPNPDSMGGNIEAWAHWLLGADIYQMIGGNEQKVSMPNFHKDNCYVWRYNKESIKEQQKDIKNNLPPINETINGYTLEAYNKDFTKAFLTKGTEVITLDVEDVKYNYDLEKYKDAVDYIVKNSKHHLNSGNLYSILKLYDQYRQQ